MNTDNPNIHNWFIEYIPAYLTNGLSAEESASFAAHAGECADCAASLASAQMQDQTLRRLFQGEAPAAGFEDRLIQQLRISAGKPRLRLSSPIRISPRVRKAAFAAVAAMLLAGVGYQGSGMLARQKPVAIVQSASNLQQMGLAIQQYQSYGYANPSPGDLSRGTGFKMTNGMEPTFSLMADIGNQASQSEPDEASASGKSKALEKQLDELNRQDKTATGAELTSKVQEAMKQRVDPSGIRELQENTQANAVEKATFAKEPSVYNGDQRRFYFNPSISTPALQGENTYTGPVTLNGGGTLNTSTYYLPYSASNSVPGMTFEVAAAPAAMSDRDSNGISDNMLKLGTAPDAMPTIVAGGAMEVSKLNSRGGQLEPFQGGFDVTTPSNKDKAGQQVLSTPALADAGQQQGQQGGKPNPSTPASGGGNSLPAKPAASNPPPTPINSVDLSRKIIRHGDLSFEVDSFDSAFAQIAKIATEENGFIATADSEKGANGKVSGMVEVRIPPDHLDTFVLKLRALGDLRGQKIASDDVTREYTDLESELRAAKAMEDRLLDIIKTGKGEVKDLVEAEKELGTWREKVEKVTGEINYYNNLIAYSTLQITLAERDIRAAALAQEQEKVNMGIETEDVEKARADALKAIEDAKGRIIQSDLKKFDAGQMAATIVAEVSPDVTGPIVDRLKQLGRVARLDMDRQQSVQSGATVPPGVHVEKKDTQLQISLYNLANIAPRQTTTMSLASDDVEQTYHAILTRIADAGGRVVNSSLNRVKPEQIDGTINCESPDDKADAVLADMRALGQVMHLSVTENPDAANVTTAKRGFAITLISSRSIAPREVIALDVMPAASVADAYHALADAARSAGADIRQAQLAEKSSESSAATLVIDVSRTAQQRIEDALAKATGGSGRIVSRQSSRSEDTEHTLDTKVQYALTLTSSASLAPRDTIARLLGVSSVGDSYNAVLAAAQQGNAKILKAQIDDSNPQQTSAELDIVVPRTNLDAVEKAIADTGADLLSQRVDRAVEASATTNDKVAFNLNFFDRAQLPPRQTTSATVLVADPQKSMADLKAAALAAGGHVLDDSIAKTDHFTAHLEFDVPISKGSDFIDKVRETGSIKSITQSTDKNVPESASVRARLVVTFSNESAPDSGPWSAVKAGLSTGVSGLLYSLNLIVVGICLTGPFALIVWGALKFWKRARKTPSAQTT